MKLAAPLTIISLFCILSIKANFHSNSKLDYGYQNPLISHQMKGRPFGSRFSNTYKKKAHEFRQRRIECCEPTVISNNKFKKETILLLSKIVKSLDEISKTLEPPLLVQIKNDNSMKDKKISNNGPNLDEGFPTWDQYIPTDGNAEKVDKKPDNFKEFKHDNKAVDSEDELDDNVRPVSFIAKTTKNVGNIPKVEHGSKFY